MVSTLVSGLVNQVCYLWDKRTSHFLPGFTALALVLIFEPKKYNDRVVVPCSTPSLHFGVSCTHCSMRHTNATAMHVQLLVLKCRPWQRCGSEQDCTPVFQLRRSIVAGGCAAASASVAFQLCPIFGHDHDTTTTTVARLQADAGCP